jgi:hypothetical protein
MEGIRDNKNIGRPIDSGRFKHSYRLIGQIESSAGSIMDNIAEGFERGNSDSRGIKYKPKMDLLLPKPLEPFELIKLLKLLNNTYATGSCNNTCSYFFSFDHLIECY